ncbi:protein kinase [Niallia oryzisoli]|uniref:Protein kinase n=1 Tax=Niallia oryzisoli TaxID=1737571 RepID=A0ABZ2CAC8_9BACI
MLKGAIRFTVDVFEKKLTNGTVINSRYEMMKFLGRGSYGSSYLVYDSFKQKEAVLKFLRMHRRFKNSGLVDFEQEQKLLKEINQPYFPQYYEKGEYNNKPFFTMEYVNGKTFEQLIFEEGKTYGEKEAFQISYELLRIIDWLHQNGIVHRDIRIPNVMFAQNQLRLIDFGLARKFDKQQLSNFPIDQIKRVISPVSDFYALGHFLLFLLYSTYEVEDNQREKSWEEELNLSFQAVVTIRKLLAIEEPYSSCSEIEKDFLQVMMA